MSEYSTYVGLNVHQDTISVAVAIQGRSEPEWRGTIRHRRSALERLIA